MSTAPARSVRRALGTYVELLVTDPAALPVGRALLDDELAALDLACSRFRPDSDLVRANQAAGRAVPVGALLREAVRAGLVAAVQTHGDVDPTLGRRLRELGYDRDFDQLPDDGPAAVEPQPAVGAWRHVELDEQEGTLRVPDGVELDLGATAKAFGADRAARVIAQATGCGVLVNLGGDLAMTGPAPAGGWPVQVCDRPGDPEPDDREQTVTLVGGGLATSSTALRTWTRGGVRHHHLLDPRTGLPVRPCWRTVSVTAGSCVDANTASTAAIVRGAAAPAWLSRLGLPARLVGIDGRVTTVAGWPAESGATPRWEAAS